MKGRPPSTSTPTAYDYRRVLALVQVLAIEDHAKQEKALLELCKGWGVDPAWLGSAEDNPRWLHVIGTMERLARHALEYSRERVNNGT